MTPLVRFDRVSLSFADRRILIAADLAIDADERVCLIGRNGAGKSTTLRLITGELSPDDGKIEIPARTRIAALDQKLADASARLVRDFVREGMAEQIERIARYEKLAAEARDPALLRDMDALERENVAGGGWHADTRVEAMITQLSLPADARLDELSGGWRRRAALGRALVSAPDLLLLDEPTNHLDISTIEWLEEQIGRYPGAVLFVTHDRAF